jgi:hypothetical protein
MRFSIALLCVAALAGFVSSRDEADRAIAAAKQE